MLGFGEGAAVGHRDNSLTLAEVDGLHCIDDSMHEREATQYIHVRVECNDRSTHCSHATKLLHGSSASGVGNGVGVGVGDGVVVVVVDVEVVVVIGAFTDFNVIVAVVVVIGVFVVGEVLVAVVFDVVFDVVVGVVVSVVVVDVVVMVFDVEAEVAVDFFVVVAATVVPQNTNSHKRPPAAAGPGTISLPPVNENVIVLPVALVNGAIYQADHMQTI